MITTFIALFIIAQGFAADDVSDGIELSGRDSDRALGQLCSGDTAEAIATDRAITAAEMAACNASGIEELVEFPLGFDALVLTSGRGDKGLGRGFDADLRELYLAAAAFVPEDDSCVLIPNPYSDWSQIVPSMPERPIRFYGAQAARNGFAARALMEGARQIECLAELERRDPQAFERAVMPRQDDIWLDMDRPVGDAVGIMSWRRYEQSRGLRPLPLAGIVPNAATLASGAYPLAHPVFVYATPEALREPSTRRLIARYQDTGDGARIRRYGSRGDTISTVEETPVSGGRRITTTQR